MTINTKLLQGSLREFGLVDLLQMMELGAMTGAIHLKQTTGRIGIVYFKDGKLAGCSELDAGALTLGDVLQQLGMATSPQINYAFSRQVQDPFGKRIGERLIEMGVITNDQLKEALRKKALWTMRELALWKEGAYEFVATPNSEAKSILPYGEEPLGLEVMGVSMEMVRYADEWEQLGYYLPRGMHTQVQMAPAIPYAMRFDTRTLELLGGINRYRSVRRIASAILRPELEVARDLALLIQQGLVLPISQEEMPRVNGDGRSVRLPGPAERLRMESFELMNLLSRMEQEWNRRRTPEEQLPALAEFANWTMDALSETCRANGADLDPNTLDNLLVRNDLRYMGTYRFIIDNNTIDVENFTALCHEVLRGDIQKAHDFFEEASIVLQHILLCIFDSINGRIASLYERLENLEVWDAMFTQFGLPRR
jgi:hypothetical protein